MAATPPPVVIIEKKRGLGCFGCGCLILVLLFLLLAGGIGAGCYFGYNQVLALTSPTQVTIPTFDGGDDVYNQAREKMNAFNHNLESHLKTTVHFSADELNTLIAHSPDFDHNTIHLFVSMNGDRARIQASVPTNLWSKNLFKDRYVHLDSTFGLTFSPDTHLLLFLPQNLQVGERVVYDANTASAQNSSTQSATQLYTANFNQFLTATIQKSPDGRALIDQAQSIEVKNSELVIETK